MKKQFAFVLTIVLCLVLGGCSQEVSLSIPFEAADVERVEVLGSGYPARKMVFLD